MRLASALVVVGFVCSAVCSTEPEQRALTVEQRVAAQRTIEQVYWSRRIWPKDNPSPKPPLSAVMSDDALRAKVEDYLAKSNALQRWWMHSVTGDQLQAEMDRMARQTKDGATLQSLFDALGDDPSLIAETLARQTLADRLLRNWYASDTRFHGDLRAKVEAAVRTCASVGCMSSMGGEYHEATWTLGTEGAREPADVDAVAIRLGPDEWKDHLARLASKLGASADALPTGRLSGIEESSDAFTVTAVVAKSDAHLVTASVTWPKRSFDAWWEVEQAASRPQTALTSGTFALPLVARTACANDTWWPTQSAMEGRYSQTAVWTGTEMIVWGGLGSSSTLQTGGRYDPATDTWTATSVGANVPTRRENHTAVWTGTQMIVWGGDSSGSYLNTGGRYDPATDTWAPTSMSANVPVRRFGHTAVWTGTRMIVWGGYNGSYLNTGARYDPTTDSWSATSTGVSLPAARYEHTAVWTGTRMIVWGGFNGSELATGGQYDPFADSWIPTVMDQHVAAARHGHTAVWTGTQMIVWGGLNSNILNTGGRYDLVTNSWSATSTGASVPEARWYHTAVWTGSRMIIWGGYNGPDLNTGGRYDPATDSWTPTSTGANVPAVRGRHTAVWTGSEMIVWGGDNPSSLLKTGGRYDPTSDSWTPTSTGANAAAARDYHTAVWTGSEMIVWGGYDGSSLNTGGRYDPATDTWTATSMGTNVPARRQSHTAVWTGTQMIVWGGYYGSYLNTGGRYDPTADSWTSTSTGASVPASRGSHAAVWTGRQMIVWGGSNGASLNTGGRYDPAADSWTTTSTAGDVPAARSAPVVWTGSEMIVWGGDSGSTRNTGGRYDPGSDSWTPTSMGAEAPAARSGHTVIWTGREMIVWGGYNYAYPNLNTGGRYDPATDSWKATSTDASVPLPRQNHTAIWTGREMIVWGGLLNPDSIPSTPLNSGGRYDPSTDTWSATSTAGDVPTNRQHHTAVWSGAEMIVWGGNFLGQLGTGGRYCACVNARMVYRDADGDGFGKATVTMPVCDAPTPNGYVDNADDCDDTNPNVHVGAAEICNGVDDDCDGIVDEGAATSCNDGNVCTVDACVHGVCAWTSVCDDGQPCTEDHADVNDNCACSHTLAYSGTACDDGNDCTSGTTCDGLGGTLASCNGGMSVGSGNVTDVSVDMSGGAAQISWSATAMASSYDVVRGALAALPVGPGDGDESCLGLNVVGTTASDAANPAPDQGFFYLIRGKAACGSGPYGTQGVHGAPSTARTTTTCGS